MKTIFRLIRDFLCALFSANKLAPDAYNTRHPIILIHGIAFRDDMPLRSWGTVPDVIKSKGG